MLYWTRPAEVTARPGRRGPRSATTALPRPGLAERSPDATRTRPSTVMNLPGGAGGRRGFWQRTINEMPGQSQLPGIFRWTPVADQLRAQSQPYSAQDLTHHALITLAYRS